QTCALPICPTGRSSGKQRGWNTADLSRLNRQCSSRAACQRSGQWDVRSFERQRELAFGPRRFSDERRDVLEPQTAHLGRDADIREYRAAIDDKRRLRLIQNQTRRGGQPAFG